MGRMEEGVKIGDVGDRRRCSAEGGGERRAGVVKRGSFAIYVK